MLASPSFILSVLLALCLVSSFVWSSRATRGFLICSLLFFLTCSMPVSVAGIEKLNQRLFNVQSTDSVAVAAYANQSFDAIIVAGWQQAYQRSDPELHRHWSERLWVAASEYRKSPAPIIVVSSQFPVPPPPKNGELPYAVLKLMEWGVAKADIINPELGNTTVGAMQSGHQALEKLGVRSVLVVAYSHRISRKSAALLNLPSNTLANLYTYSVKNEVTTLNAYGLGAWIPNKNAFHASHFLLHELAAHLVYRLVNWI